MAALRLALQTAMDARKTQQAKMQRASTARAAAEARADKSEAHATRLAQRLAASEERARAAEAREASLRLEHVEETTTSLWDGVEPSSMLVLGAAAVALACLLLALLWRARRRDAPPKSATKRPLLASRDASRESRSSQESEGDT